MGACGGSPQAGLGAAAPTTVSEGAPSSVQKGVKHPPGQRGQGLGRGAWTLLLPGHTRPLVRWPEKGPVQHTGTVLGSAGPGSVTGHSWARVSTHGAPRGRRRRARSRPPRTLSAPRPYGSWYTPVMASDHSALIWPGGDFRLFSNRENEGRQPARGEPRTVRAGRGGRVGGPGRAQGGDGGALLRGTSLRGLTADPITAAWPRPPSCPLSARGPQQGCRHWGAPSAAAVDSATRHRRGPDLEMQSRSKEERGHPQADRLTRLSNS